MESYGILSTLHCPFAQLMESLHSCLGTLGQDAGRELLSHCAHGQHKAKPRDVNSELQRASIGLCGSQLSPCGRGH